MLLFQDMDENKTTPTTANQQSPVRSVDGQLSGSHIEQLPSQKLSRWRYFFVILGILQGVGVGLFLLAMQWAAESGNADVSGTEFIALFLISTAFMVIVPVVAVIAVINLIGLPIYMRKHKPRGVGFVFAVVSLVISAVLALFGAYSAYELATYKTTTQRLSDESRQKNEQRQQEFAANNAAPEITKEEAIELLKTCKLKGFYYTHQTDKSDPVNGGWGELSSTGVVVTKLNGQPYRISIADRLIPELVPIAREAQKTCSGLQFWHDGAYEQYENGKWYFKGEVVDDTKRN